jgi:hypothetical protein
MPFARISVLKGKSSEYLTARSDGLHPAFVATFEVPSDEGFRAIRPHEPAKLILIAAIEAAHARMISS